MRVAVLAFNLIDNDSRVLRTTRSLHNAGCEVHLIAYGTKPSNCSTQFHSLGRPPTRIQHWQGILTGRVVSAVMSNRLQNMAGPRDVYRHCRAMIAKIRPDVVHAND